MGPVNAIWVWLIDLPGFLTIEGWPEAWRLKQYPQQCSKTAVTTLDFLNQPAPKEGDVVAALGVAQDGLAMLTGKKKLAIEDRVRERLTTAFDARTRGQEPQGPAAVVERMRIVSRMIACSVSAKAAPSHGALPFEVGQVALLELHHTREGRGLLIQVDSRGL